jgi:hypothetical protein
MSLHRAKALTAALAAVACILVPAVVATPSQAVPEVGSDPAVITEWNAIATRTIFTENGTPVQSSPLYFSFVSIAMYDAVVTIEGGFEPYAEQPRAHAHASPEVAAATAAFRVLSHYFPASAANLAADYAASLTDVPDGVGMVHGKRVGEAAAAAIIALREDDGRGDATITLDVAPDDGVWRPTPDAFAPMALPWLGFVTPLVLDSLTEVSVPGPDAIDSDAYTQDFNEVKEFGAKEDSSRSPEQLQTAQFWNFNPVLQMQVAMREQVTDRGLDIVEGSRAFALLSTSEADALIACWRVKYDVPYWRPLTAIHLAGDDGNEATVPDEDWNSFLVTPPYPDYPSGHACHTGAASGTFAFLFGADSIDLDVFSGATATTRHYDTAGALDEETMNARIWQGIHFRKAMTDGNALGHAVVEQAAKRFETAG